MQEYCFAVSLSCIHNVKLSTTKVQGAVHTEIIKIKYGEKISCNRKLFMQC